MGIQTEVKRTRSPLHSHQGSFHVGVIFQYIL